MAGSVSGSRRSGTSLGRLGAAKLGAGRRRRRFAPVNTRRAAILALVICALALTVAAPLRTYVHQRSKIAEQHAKQQTLTTRLHRLQHREKLLADPHYIRTQARKRLLYVEKGATPYIVDLPGHGADRAHHAAPGGGDPPQHQRRAWYEKLWKALAGSGG
jgi:cell division protein FtsB